MAQLFSASKLNCLGLRQRGLQLLASFPCLAQLFSASKLNCLGPRAATQLFSAIKLNCLGLRLHRSPIAHRMRTMLARAEACVRDLLATFDCETCSRAKNTKPARESEQKGQSSVGSDHLRNMLVIIARDAIKECETCPIRTPASAQTWGRFFGRPDVQREWLSPASVH